jgi:hypothetical protein
MRVKIFRPAFIDDCPCIGYICSEPRPSVGRIAAGRPQYGASAVPARGLATRSRAASGLPPDPALRPVCEKHRWTVAGRFAGNARLKAPAREARNWSRVVAFGRLSQNRGGAPIDVRLAIQARPWPTLRQNTVASVGVSLPIFSFVRSRSFFLSSLPGLTRQSMPKLRSLSASTGVRARRVSMDHRIKSGGDDL